MAAKRKPVDPRTVRNVLEYEWEMVRTRSNPVEGTFHMTGYPSYKLDCGHHQYESPAGHSHEKKTKIACRGCAKLLEKGHPLPATVTLADWRAAEKRRAVREVANAEKALAAAREKLASFAAEASVSP
jgi:hypothetical protein